MSNLAFGTLDLIFCDTLQSSAFIDSDVENDSEEGGGRSLTQTKNRREAVFRNNDYGFNFLGST